MSGVGKYSMKCAVNEEKLQTKEEEGVCRVNMELMQQMTKGRKGVWKKNVAYAEGE